MADIYFQITNLIVQPSGSMVYHLVIAFIFISVLQPALSFIPTEDKDQRKRLLIGVGLLIASRLVVFVVAILSILETAGFSNILGVVEQAINVLDITIMIWLFAFQKKHRTGDIGLALFGLFILAAGLISSIYWSIQESAGIYNQDYLAIGWEAITLIVVVIGLVTLNFSKSPAKMQGIFLLFILLVGEVLQMILSPAEGDYFPISRLAHLIAFPLLVGILQNYTFAAEFPSSGESATEDTDRDEEKDIELDQTSKDILDLIISSELDVSSEEKEQVSHVSSKALDLHIYQNSVNLANSKDPQEIFRLFTRLTAHALLADLCLLLTPPDQNGQVHLLGGYDLIVQESVETTSFDSNVIPRFKKIFENGRPIQLLDQGNEKMYEFADLLRVDDIGNMMAYPIKDNHEQVIAVIALISPYSKHIWNADDQEYLKAAIEPINTLLNQALIPQSENNQLDSLKEELELKEKERAQLVEEKSSLEAKVADLSEKVEVGPPPPPEIEELVVQTKSLESAMNLIQEENQQLQDKLDQITEETKTLTAEHQKTLKEKQTLAKEHARLLEEQKVLATEHALVLEEKAILQDQSETSQEVQAQLDALAYANDDLAKKNQELISANESLSSEKNELKELSEELAQRNTEIGKNNESLESKIKEINDENTYLRENLTHLQKEHEEMLTGIAENGDPTSHLQDDLQKALDMVAELEQKLAETTESLEALKQFRTQSNGQALSSEQEEVVASIAQELRQPMSSISGYTDLLISESVGILGALQKKFLERVKASTERMNQLVNDLVHVTTIDSGNYLFTLQPLELMDVIDNAIETTSGQFREKEISLRVNINPNLPKLHTDKDALQQIVLHLLQNASTATPAEGEVLLKAQLYDKTKDDVILLSVTDTGEGIPKEDLPRVFSRLYRADNPLIQGVGDTGVGLSIAKTLTEALGGRIWVESEPDSGSTYSVLLPTTSPTMTQQEG